MEKQRPAILAGYSSSFKSCFKIFTYKSNIAALQKNQTLNITTNKRDIEQLASNKHRPCSVHGLYEIQATLLDPASGLFTSSSKARTNMTVVATTVGGRKGGTP
jgi:hypothetical protein